MPKIPMSEAEKAALRRSFTLLRSEVHERGVRISYQDLAQDIGVSADTIESWFKVRSRIDPERLRDIARILQVNPIPLFLAAGWADVGEVAKAAEDAGGVLSIEQSAERPTAPQRAVDVLTHDPVLRDRFTVTVSALTTKGRYRLTTDLAAEFRLRPEEQPLPFADAVELAAGARSPWRPSSELAATQPEYCSVMLELAAAFKPRLRQYGLYTWQGEPGSAVWRGAAFDWPAHIMVQDVVSGVCRPAREGAWSPTRAKPVIVIGGRYSAGLAAPLLAQALGWQYIVVHSGTVVGPDGDSSTVDRDWGSGPAHAWLDAYFHIAERGENRSPWRCVLLIRPNSFVNGKGELDLDALEQLRRTDAHVVYARPAEATLRWWTERQVGLSIEGSYRTEAERQLAVLRVALAGIESTLNRRAGRRLDLTVALPEPKGDLEPHSPLLPAQIVDAQARLAWQALRWLSLNTRYAGTKLEDTLCPGSLEDWRELLRADGEPAPASLFANS